MINMEQLGEVAKKREQARRKTGGRRGNVCCKCLIMLRRIK